MKTEALEMQINRRIGYYFIDRKEKQRKGTKSTANRTNEKYKNQTFKICQTYQML